MLVTATLHTSTIACPFPTTTASISAISHTKQMPPYNKLCTSLQQVVHASHQHLLEHPSRWIILSIHTLKPTFVLLECPVVVDTMHTVWSTIHHVAKLVTTVWRGLRCNGSVLRCNGSVLRCNGSVLTCQLAANIIHPTLHSPCLQAYTISRPSATSPISNPSDHISPTYISPHCAPKSSYLQLICWQLNCTTMMGWSSRNFRSTSSTSLVSRMVLSLWRSCE